MNINTVITINKLTKTEIENLLEDWKYLDEKTIKKLATQLVKLNNIQEWEHALTMETCRAILSNAYKLPHSSRMRKWSFTKDI